MRTIVVVPINVLRYVFASSANAVVGTMVDLLVLHGTPQPFDKNAIALCPLTVHGKFLTSLCVNVKLGQLNLGSIGCLDSCAAVNSMRSAN